MKPLVLTSLFVTFSFLPCVAASDYQEQWLVQNADERSDSIILVGNDGTPSLQFLGTEGVVIGEGPESGDDKKSVVFSGQQPAAFRTERGFPTATSGLSVAVDVRPSEETIEQDGTILRHGTSWEIRYSPVRGAFSFIVWHDAKDYSEVRVAATKGEWQTLEARYEEGKISLMNGNNSSESVLTLPIRPDNTAAALLLGGSTPVITNPESGRPFAGSLANIRLGME